MRIRQIIFQISLTYNPVLYLDLINFNSFELFINEFLSRHFFQNKSKIQNLHIVILQKS